MRARRLKCRTPTGTSVDVIAFEGLVVLPDTLRDEPGLWWLESEHHPRLGLDASRGLEAAAGGASLGCWPYVVSVERWREATLNTYWLPGIPTAPGDAPDFDRRCDVNPRMDTLCTSALGLRHPQAQAVRRPTRPGRDRFSDGAAAVTALFAPIARAATLVLTVSSLAACAYYIAALSLWLWALRDGMADAEVQAGGTLLAAAMVAMSVTTLLEDRFRFAVLDRARLGPVAGRQPLIELALDVFRAGVVLQLLAFAGFVVT